MPWFPWLIAPTQYELLAARYELERQQAPRTSLAPSLSAHPRCDYCHALPAYQDYPTHTCLLARTPTPPAASPIQQKRAEIERLRAQIDVLEAATIDTEERGLRLRPKLRVWARRGSAADAGRLWRMFERDRRL